MIEIPGNEVPDMEIVERHGLDVPIETCNDLRTAALTIVSDAKKGIPFNGWRIDTEVTEWDKSSITFQQGKKGSSQSKVTMGYDEASVVHVKHEYVTQTQEGSAVEIRELHVTPVGAQGHAVRELYSTSLAGTELVGVEPIPEYTVERWQEGISEIAADKGKASDSLVGSRFKKGRLAGWLLAKD